MCRKCLIAEYHTDNAVRTCGDLRRPADWAELGWAELDFHLNDAGNRKYTGAFQFELERLDLPSPCTAVAKHLLLIHQMEPSKSSIIKVRTCSAELFISVFSRAAGQPPRPRSKVALFVFVSVVCFATRGAYYPAIWSTFTVKLCQ